jgi:CheY-like chemotaxis protein
MTGNLPAAANPANGQQRILFVDDDAEYLQMIDRLLRLWSNNRIEVLTAPSASAALAILQSGPPDLIVMDVCMPVVDGLQLLSIVARRYPGVPKVVLTSQPDQASRDACLNNGAELFLEKPKSSEGFDSVFSTLDEFSKWKPEAGFRGMLRSVGLTDILQMECIAKSSSILAVTRNEVNGSIYIRDGCIIHAEAGELKGEDAFKRLIALISGDFFSKPFSQPPEETIQLPWETLLMDAAQWRDELLGSQPVAPSEEVPLETGTSQRLTIPERALPPIEIDELLIASESGEVYHSWQCANVELRINLLDTLSRKARQVVPSLPFGSFDRVEFHSSASRLIAQCGNGRGILVRSSAVGTATQSHDWPTNRIRASRNKAQQWFESQLELPGLFAGALQFPDKQGPLYARTTQFTTESIASLKGIAVEGYQISKLQRFPAQRARWVFEQMVVETAQWSDHTLLLLVFNRRALELNASFLSERLAEFLNLDAA